MRANRQRNESADGTVEQQAGSSQCVVHFESVNSNNPSVRQVIPPIPTLSGLLHARAVLRAWYIY